MSDVQSHTHHEALSVVLKVLSGETPGDAVTVTQDFLKQHPERSEGYFILGVLTYLSGYIGDATSMLERAHDIDPDVREYAEGLSGLYVKSDRLNDALYFAKLGAVLESHPEMAGVLPPELKNFVNAAGWDGIHRHYVAALMAFDRRDFATVIAECDLELKMDPSYVPALDLYARTLTEMGEYGDAIPVLQRVLQLKPDSSAEVSLSLADAICHLGLFEQARQYIDATVQSDPESTKAGIQAFYLLSKMPGAEQASERVWKNLQHAGLVEQDPYFEYTPSSDGITRIGFLSDKCYDCFEGAVLSQLLRRFDKKMLEPYVYIQNINKDGVTQTIKNWSQSAREVYDVNDKTLALIMQRDGIDILVDMCGAGANQRLMLLARQPCGLRISWLSPSPAGGQPGINYVITDVTTDAAQARLLQGDQACMQLRTPLFARKPIRGYEDPAPPPVVEKGYITFGSHLDFRALSSGDGALWARVLDSVPGSKLRLYVGGRMSEISLARLNEIFEPLGLLDRIELYSPDEDERLGGFFDRVDIFLASQTEKMDVILEALWMGTPCLTWTDANSRQVTYSGAVIHAAGIPSWVCDGEEAFLSMAKSLAFNQTELEGLRGVLRHQVVKSALIDLDGFAVEFQGRMAELFIRQIQKG